LPLTKALVSDALSIQVNAQLRVLPNLGPMKQSVERGKLAAKDAVKGRLGATGTVA
jgi:hypothetical protein